MIALDCRYALSFDLSFHLFSPSLRLEVGLLIELRAVVPWICQEYFILFPGLSYLKRDTRQSASERINKRTTVITSDTYIHLSTRGTFGLNIGSFAYQRSIIKDLFVGIGTVYLNSSQTVMCVFVISKYVMCFSYQMFVGSSGRTLAVRVFKRPLKVFSQEF